MTKVQFGVNLPHVEMGSKATPDEMLRFAQRSEDYGFDSLWVLDRILSYVEFLDPLQILAFVAGRTNRTRLGSAVIMTPLRSPVLLAKSVSTLDAISKGRVILGLALGGQSAEYEACGVRITERVARFVEGLRIMKMLWTEPTVEFSGRFWTLPGVSMLPKPIQKPYPPVWIGGAADPVLRRAVKHSDGWVAAGSMPFGKFLAGVERIKMYLREDGHESSKITISKRLYIHVGPDRDQSCNVLEASLKGFYTPHPRDVRDGFYTPREYGVYGTLSECVREIEKYVHAGARYIILNPVKDYQEQLRIYAMNILPNFS